MYYNAFQMYRKLQTIYNLYGSKNIACGSKNTTEIHYDYTKQLGFPFYTLRKIASRRSKKSIVRGMLKFIFKQASIANYRGTNVQISKKEILCYKPLLLIYNYLSLFLNFLNLMCL